MTDCATKYPALNSDDMAVTPINGNKTNPHSLSNRALIKCTSMLYTDRH